MVTSRHRFLIPGIVPLAVVSLLAFQAARRAPDTAGPLSDPFAAGWILTDTNGDGIIDFVAGKVVVPAQPTAVENAAAADIAARLGFATTGLTPPIVIGAADDRNDGPRIWIGRSAVPSQYVADADRNAARLDAEEGGVFAIGGGLAVFGRATMRVCWLRLRRSLPALLSSGRRPVTDSRRSAMRLSRRLPAQHRESLASPTRRGRAE